MEDAGHSETLGPLGRLIAAGIAIVRRGVARLYRLARLRPVLWWGTIVLVVMAIGSNGLVLLGYGAFAYGRLISAVAIPVWLLVSVGRYPSRGAKIAVAVAVLVGVVWWQPLVTWSQREVYPQPRGTRHRSVLCTPDS